MPEKLNPIEVELLLELLLNGGAVSQKEWQKIYRGAGGKKGNTTLRARGLIDFELRITDKGRKAVEATCKTESEKSC